MAKILMAGLGWLGYPLAKKLVDQQNKVVGITRSPEKLSTATNFQIHQSDFSEIPEILNEEIFEIGIYTIPPQANQERAEKTISNFIQFALAREVKKAIYISSTSVYPNLNREVFEEDSKRIVSKHSGVAITDLEDLWSNSPLQTSILRMGGLHGPNRDPGRFFKSEIIPNPDMPVNMTSLDFALEGIMAVLNEDQFGEIFNCVETTGETRFSFYQKFNLNYIKGESSSSDFKIVNSDKIRALF